MSATVVFTVAPLCTMGNTSVPANGVDAAASSDILTFAML
jgi:hypothetical protein